MAIVTSEPKGVDSRSQTSSPASPRSVRRDIRFIQGKWKFLIQAIGENKKIKRKEKQSKKKKYQKQKPNQDTLIDMKTRGQYLTSCRT